MYEREIKGEIKMLDVGRVCVKIAGRDAGNFCVIVDRIDDSYVLIDGNVRRKKCNIIHLEPTSKILKIKKSADSKTVIDLMKKEGLEIIKKGARREKKKQEKKSRLQHNKPAKVEKKKETKKEIKKTEEKKSSEKPIKTEVKKEVPKVKKTKK